MNQCFTKDTVVYQPFKSISVSKGIFTMKIGKSQEIFASKKHLFRVLRKGKLLPEVIPVDEINLSDRYPISITLL